MDAAATNAATSAAQQQKAPRLPEIDRLRGLVIVIMALDHMRDFFDADALRFSPTDLSHTYAVLFLTRFITHYCAPTFTFLAGVSAYLRLENSSRPALSKFLLTRGLWLIFLDAVVISPVWTLQFGKIELGTLWAIGGGMVALAALVHLPSVAALGLGAAILAAHNLLDGVHAADFGAYSAFWSLLHEPGPLPLGLSGGVLYPLLPWIGVIALGYGLGPVFALPAARRDALFTGFGLGALALFALLRGFNIYGDARLWSVQTSPLFTAFSFLNVTKYPPSLLYALVTLGPALLLLPLLARVNGALGRALCVFGQTPLFFYVLHLYVGQAAAIALEFARGFDAASMSDFVARRAPPETFGVGLAGAYVAWIALVIALYPLCAWFAAVKRRRRDWWLSYL
jgi:uncharacterized membrane protein